MKPSLNLYPLEKFGQAFTALATGPGRIKDRLESAYIAFHPVKSVDLPDSARADFEWVKTMLTSKEAIEDEGRVRASLNAMDENLAVEIAHRIVAIHHTLRTWIEEQRD